MKVAKSDSFGSQGAVLGDCLVWTSSVVLLMIQGGLRQSVALCACILATKPEVVKDALSFVTGS